MGGFNSFVVCQRGKRPPLSRASPPFDVCRLHVHVKQQPSRPIAVAHERHEDPLPSPHSADVITFGGWRARERKRTGRSPHLCIGSVATCLSMSISQHKQLQDRLSQCVSGTVVSDGLLR